MVRGNERSKPGRICVRTSLQKWRCFKNEFFKSANYLYPFGILVLKKIKNIENKEAEKEFLSSVDSLTNDYMNFMIQNGVINESFFKGTFLGDDLNFCNEIRAAIETTIKESS